MCTGSELSVAGFVRFIAGLAVSRVTPQEFAEGLGRVVAREAGLE
jgi:hypothetical protein